MDITEYVFVFYIFLSIGLFVFVLDHMYRRTKADFHRETLFTLRDELFDYMWKNDKSFDLPAYHVLREHLNQSIRVADLASPLAFFILVLMASRHPKTQHHVLAEIGKAKDTATRKRLIRTHDAVTQSWFWYMGVLGNLLPLIATRHHSQNRAFSVAADRAVEAGHRSVPLSYALAGGSRVRPRTWPF